MSFASVNGAAVVSAAVSLPLVGAWVADVRIDSREPVEGEAVLRLGDALELRGMVVSGGVHAGAAYARIVGGKGKLATELPARYYRDVPTRIPISDALTEAGEALASSSDPVLLDAWLSLWARTAGRASDALAWLLEAAGGGAWRVLPDGSVWVGQDAWKPAPRFDFVEIEEHPAERRVEIATEEPKLLPGKMFLAKRVSHVRHVLSPEASGRMSTSSDRIIEAVRRIIRPLLSRIDYLALYPARIVTQAADGTLEVVPDDERLPGMTRVALRTFLPGVEVKVKDGGRVLVGFEGGDPSKPVATLFDGGAIESLTITAEKKITIDAAEVDLVKTGGRQMAAVGDMVAVTIPIGLVTQGAGSAAAPNTIPLPIYGAITTGSPKRKVP